MDLPSHIPALTDAVLPLLSERQTAVCLAMDGMLGLFIAVLAHQARRSFLLWTGIQIPTEEFQQVLDSSGLMSMAS